MQARKGFIYFITFPLIFKSRENRSQKKACWSDGGCVSATSFWISVEFKNQVRFSSVQKNRDEKIKLLSRVFSADFVSFGQLYSENK